MANTEPIASRAEQRSSGRSVYDGFISYSHAADDLLAPRLQSGLQRFAKPWWKRRALRIFRDESSLSANPHLWSSITEALDTSDWFVLLLSPDAAESPWVNQEIEYWRQHRNPERILPVLTDGEFSWSGSDVSGDAAPDQLRGAYAEEPRWVDLRFAREEEQLDLKNPRFSNAVADISSALRGIPKDELESEEVKQHRRTIRIAWGAATLVGALAVAASMFGFQSARNAQRAKAEALAAASLSQLEVDPERSLLLALESLRRSNTPTGMEALHKSMQSHRTVWARKVTCEVEGNCFEYSYLHPDQSQIISVSAVDGLVTLWDTSSHASEPLWEKQIFNSDGVDVFFGRWNEAGTKIWLGVSDLSVNRSVESVYRGIFEIDVATGDSALVRRFGGCLGGLFDNPSSREDLTLLVGWLQRGEDPNTCANPFTGLFDELIVLDGLEDEGGVVLQFDEPFTTVGAWPTLTSDGSMVALSNEHGAFVFDASTGEPAFELEGTKPTLSPDGSLLLVRAGEFVELIELETGEVQKTFSGDFSTIYFSPDRSMFIGATFEQGVQAFDLESGRLVYELVGPESRTAYVDMHAGTDLLLAHSFAETRLWRLSPHITEATPPFDEVIPQARFGWEQRGGMRMSGDLLHLPGEIDGEPGYAVYQTSSGRLLRQTSDVWPLSKLSPSGRVLEIPVLEKAPGQPTHFGRPRLVEAETGQVEMDLPQTCGFFADPSRPQFTPGPDCDPGDVYLPLIDAEFSSDGSVVALDTLDGKPTVLDLRNSQVMFTQNFGGFDMASRTIALSTDGRLFAYRTATPVDGALSWDLVGVDLDTGEELGRAPICNPNSEAFFAPDQQSLLTANWCADIVIFDVATWSETKRLGRGQGGTLEDMALSGNRIATTGLDQTLRVWDIDKGQVELEVKLQSLPRNVDFLDPDHLIVITVDGEVLVFTLDPSELIELALSRLTRGLTEEECTVYTIDPCPTLDGMREG